MSLPTDGFTVTSVNYTFGTSNGLAVAVSIDTESPVRQAAADELLPYLEAALDSFRTNYQGGTPETVLYIERMYNGSLQGSV